MTDLFLASLEARYAALIDKRDALHPRRHADRAALQRRIEALAQRMLEIATGRAA